MTDAGEALLEDEACSSDSESVSDVSDLLASDDNLSDEFVWEVDANSIAPSNVTAHDIMDRSQPLPGQTRMINMIKSLEARAMAEEVYKRRKQEKQFRPAGPALSILFRGVRGERAHRQKIG